MRKIISTMKTAEVEKTQPKNGLKRMKLEEKEDQMSALPDCLLIEILSRLPKTRDAIKTSTLSK